MIGARAIVATFAFTAFPSQCQPKTWLHGGGSVDHVTPTAQRPAATTRPVAPLRIEPLNTTDPVPTFVMRGEPHGSGKLVFIHGICGHGLGYAQSFQWSAAKHGVLIAPQGDVPCSPGSPWAKWSLDVATLDVRIVAAFRALGTPKPDREIAVIGYSQGASRAEALARRWPERYTRLILIAGPTKVSPYGLSVTSALMMAGTLDRQDLMQRSAKAFAAAGRRARYLPLPNGRHGSMGDTPEQTMGAALDWLYQEAPNTVTD